MASILDQTKQNQDRAMELAGNTEANPDQKAELINPLVGKIQGYMQEAESSRRTWETQAIKNIKSYRGQDVEKGRESEVADVYVRTTTVKTRAAYAHIMESIMNNSRFPLMIEATPVPEGIARYATTQDGAPMQPSPDSQEDFGIGFEGDGRQLSPGATFDNMGFLEDENSDYNGASLKEGKDRSGGQGAQIRPAELAAEQWNRVLQDQLEESNAHTELRQSVFESCLIGTGIMKGIFTEEKTINRWVDGVYKPEKKIYPKVSHVSAWDLYVDPNAFNIDDAEWTIERHRYTAKNLRDLKAKAFFDREKIDLCISSGANYSEKSFEHTVRSDEPIVNNGRLWEVLEYWGYLSIEEARQAGMVVDGSPGDQVQVNLWICGNQVIRATVNPFLPQRLPYFVFNYEVNPYSFYGTGVPETMEDSQKQMNGFVRLAIDNLALAGNMVFDVDESMLVAGQDMSLYPGKIFRRQGGQPGQAVHALKFNSTAQENMMMFSQMRQLADESTGIPSVAHGQTGVTGTGRTSSGLSMILENASLNIKTVIRNIDDNCLQPLGTMLFFWNNQFNSENLPQGDMDVIATGVRSYTKQEIRTQRLQTLMQLGANPAVAPLIRFPALIRDLVKSMDLDPDAYVNDMDDARIYAEIIGAAGGLQGGRGAQAASNQAQLAEGQVPGAMDAGFTGNNAGAGNPGGLNGSEVS